MWLNFLRNCLLIFLFSKNVHIPRLISMIPSRPLWAKRLIALAYPCLLHWGCNSYMVKGQTFPQEISILLEVLCALDCQILHESWQWLIVIETLFSACLTLWRIETLEYTVENRYRLWFMHRLLMNRAYTSFFSAPRKMGFNGLVQLLFFSDVFRSIIVVLLERAWGLLWIS